MNDGGNHLLHEEAELTEHEGLLDGSVRSRHNAVQLFFQTSFWGKIVVLTLKEIRKSKFRYFLGFFSCLIVVLVVSILATTLSKSTVVFLAMAEAETGQIDVQISLAEWTPNNFLNYTLITELLRDNEELSFSSPRYDQSVSVISASKCPSYLDPFDPNWKYNGLGNSTCSQKPKLCFLIECPKAELAGASLILVDTIRENKMELGREWIRQNHPDLKEGEAYISSELANALDVEIGSVIYVLIDLKITFNGIWQVLVSDKDDTGYMFLPVTIIDVFEGYQGKISMYQESVLIMEYGKFMGHLIGHLNPNIPNKAASQMELIDLYHHAQIVMWNLPPPRVPKYIDTNVDNIRRTVKSIASQIFYEIGFRNIMTETPVLESLAQTAQYSLMLGLVLDVAVSVLLFLAVILIYSLLTIDVESKAVDLAILRSLGTNRAKVVYMLTVQAFAFAIPAWALGIPMAQAAVTALSAAFVKVAGVDIGMWLSANSLILATIVIMTVPGLASIFPILSVLGKNIAEGMDRRRSRTKAVSLSVERAENIGKISGAYLVAGICTAGLGFFIYYVFPYSLLTQDYNVFIYVMVSLLIGMLLGLVTIAQNFQHVLQKFLIFFLLFWERLPVREILIKNMISHKKRNAKTTTMYSLSLGFVLFLAVVWGLEQSIFMFDQKQSGGTYFRVYSKGFLKTDKLKIVNELEELAGNHALIVGHAWASSPLQLAYPPHGDFLSENLCRVGSYPIQVYAVSPNFFDVAHGEFFLNPDGRSGSEVLTELYSMEGFMGVVLPTFVYKNLQLDRKEDSSVILRMVQYGGTTEGGDYPEISWKTRPIAHLDGSPFFRMSKFDLKKEQDVLVSATTYMELSNGTYLSAEELPVRHFFIKLRDGWTDREYADLRNQLQALIAEKDPESLLHDYMSNTVRARVGNGILSYFFALAILIAMVICFFSLMSSMYTNIHEQTKEIGVLRVLGVDSTWMYRIFIHEAFVLVLSSAILGAMIGTTIAWTMLLQHALYTQLPLTFVFPWELYLLIFATSIVCAFLSSWSPVRMLIKRETVDLLRG